MGLALVRAVVDEVGGTISLGLSPTTFRVVLPTGLS